MRASAMLVRAFRDQLGSEGLMEWGFYRPYVSAAERRAKALREKQKLARMRMRVSPVKVAGRAIVSTFWGKAWCDNLESYSDYSNRLPRGRTYVRNGSIVDLQIEPGKVTSLVSGSSLYHVTIRIQPLAAQRWKKIQEQCGTQIGSLVELLQGRLSKSVMEIVTRSGTGLFPAPEEIELSCSCPDWAEMCKHVAATLYGVGCHLDHAPELLFKLRQVDHTDLIAQAGKPATSPKKISRKTIAKDRLADVFGIELEGIELEGIELETSGETTDTVPPAKPARRQKSARPKEKDANRIGKTKAKRDKSSAAGRANRTA